MKKSIKTIVTIATIGIMLVSAYWLGTTQAKTITEVQTVTEISEIVPSDYIPLDQCIPLEDVACCYLDCDGYICFELKDIAYQLDDVNNKSYADIIANLENETESFRNNFVDMRQVTDFTTDDNGLYLYLEDGTGYYWER